jgi:hypothetical protein
MKNLFASAAALTLLLLVQVAKADTVNLPGQNVRACIGKKTTVVQSGTQCNEIVIDGKTSNKSTFGVNGKILRLIADVDEANLVAKCRRAGNETFAIEMEINNANRTRYVYNLTINCMECEE